MPVPKTMIVSPAQGQVRGWKASGWSEFFPVDVPLQDADENEFDALLLPGGKMNLESLQADEKAIAFVRSFVESSKTELEPYRKARFCCSKRMRWQVAD